MNLTVFYSEIQDYVREHCHIPMAKPDITLSHLDDSSLNVKLALDHFLSPSVDIKVHVESCSDDEVLLSYDYPRIPIVGNIIDGLIAKFIEWLERWIPKGVDVYPNEKKIHLHLSKIEGVDKAMDYLKLESVIFQTNDINISLGLK